MTVEEAKEQDHGVLCQHPSPSPQFPPPSPCRHHCRLTVVCSSFCRRSRSRRHHNKLSLPTTTSTSSFEPKLEAVIDLTPLTAFQSELRRRFLSSGKDAYQDLQTLVTLDHNRRFSSWHRNTSSHKLVVVRRDRSLGGKEVVVAWVREVTRIRYQCWFGTL
ncbi:hypothetical protein GYH30_033720 [Glycine max]|nr:hypothetical protein GYH30_033720 [Glycine max]